MSSRSSRGLRGICIALQNSGKVGAFNEGRQNVADMRQPGRPSVSEEEVYALTALLDSDRCHTIRELAQETELAHTTVLHILKERLGMRKTAS